MKNSLLYCYISVNVISMARGMFMLLYIFSKSAVTMMYCSLRCS
jgi:hypothetical protein